MADDKKDEQLPPRPGENPVKKEIKGTPFDVYINGQSVRMSRQEALGAMSQIINILCYFDQQEADNG